MMEMIKEAVTKIYGAYANFVSGLVPALAGFEWSILVGVAVIILLTVAIIVGATSGKKIIFMVDGKRYAITKSKRRKEIKYPEAPKKEGFEFGGWYKDQNFTLPYTKTAIVGKTNMSTLKLYAKFEEIKNTTIDDLIEKYKNEPELDMPTESVEPEVAPVQAEPTLAPVEVAPEVANEVAPEVAEEVKAEEDQLSLYDEVAPEEEKPALLLSDETEPEDDRPVLSFGGAAATAIVEPEEEKPEEEVAFETEPETEPEVQTEEEPEFEPEEEKPVLSLFAEPKEEIPAEEEKPVLSPIFAPIQETESDLGRYYDELRFTMLGYERSPQFKKLGVKNKQVVAQMFEGNGAINLYLAIDPELMKLKGHDVTSYDRPEFAVAPCRKVIKDDNDFAEALKLVEDAMLVNNLVKSGTPFAKPVKSDERTRKSGFAFFIKNENVATTSVDYYRLLRAIVLSYKPADTSKILDEYNGRMILKIFKKGENISVYFALNPETEGLKNVGYDRNFVDTPAVFEVNTSDDCLKVNELIEKLMFSYGMVKFPESVEISLEEPVLENCGFGYRIKK